MEPTEAVLHCMNAIRTAVVALHGQGDADTRAHELIANLIGERDGNDVLEALYRLLPQFPAGRDNGLLWWLIECMHGVWGPTSWHLTKWQRDETRDWDAIESLSDRRPS